MNIRKVEKVGVKVIKTDRDKAKIVCCTVASFLMSLVIILNMILIVKIYIGKQRVPDVFGFFPLISLADDAAPSVRKGDLVFCRKADGDSIMPGELVAYYADNSREKISVRTVGRIDGETALLLLPDDKDGVEVRVDRIIAKCRLSVPILGYVIYFISTIPGFLLCVVVPAILITEIYLYFRRKRAVFEEDEESLLMEELEALRAERKMLLERLKDRTAKERKEKSAVRLPPAVRTKATVRKGKPTGITRKDERRFRRYPYGAKRVFRLRTVLLALLSCVLLVFLVIRFIKAAVRFTNKLKAKVKQTVIFLKYFW